MSSHLINSDLNALASAVILIYKHLNTPSLCTDTELNI